MREKNELKKAVSLLLSLGSEVLTAEEARRDSSRRKTAEVQQGDRLALQTSDPRRDTSPAFYVFRQRRHRGRVSAINYRQDDLVADDTARRAAVNLSKALTALGEVLTGDIPRQEIRAAKTASRSRKPFRVSSTGNYCPICDRPVWDDCSC